MTPEELEKLLSCTKMFMNHVHWVQQSFNLVPNKDHLGTSINFIDLQEFREEFCTELVNTIPEWVYSNSKATAIIDDLVSEGRSPINAQMAFANKTFEKFRNSDTRDVTLQGQFGELLLFNFLQAFFNAVPLLRKMPITTSSEMERFGADAIHYNFKDGKHLFFLGEAKTYTSKYRFNLTVPREICSRNRYWDPIDLNKLYLSRTNYTLPTSASENFIANRLKAALLILKQDFPVYYGRYFGVENAFDKNGREIDNIMRMCILTDKWLKEKSLFELFCDPYYDSPFKVESTISDLQNKISYGLPLLLKPIYDMAEPETMFTRFIELGAYLPVTRKFIELNIPRETAIYLTNNFTFTNVDDKHSLMRQLRAVKPQLSYWHKVQLSSI